MFDPLSNPLSNALLSRHLSAGGLVALLAGRFPRPDRAQSHLERCAACRSDHAALAGVVESVAPTSGDGAMPPERVRATVQEAARREMGAVRTARRPLAWGTARVIAAAVSVVALVGLSGIVATRRAATPAPGIAYAEVLEAMRQVRTAHWTETFLLVIRTKGQTHTFRDASECWVRLGKNLALVRKETLWSSDRSPQGHTSYRLFDSQGKAFRKVIRNGQVKISPLNHEGDARKRRVSAWYLKQGIEKQLAEPTSQSMRESSMMHVLSKRANPTPVQVRQEVGADGRTYKVLYAAVGKPHPTCERTVWVDAKTHRIARDEEVTHFGSSDSRSVREHFRYDETPPAGTFDWKMPQR